ncbi:MAG: penicillin acylase family protein [Myxococcota bacterium]
MRWRRLAAGVAGFVVVAGLGVVGGVVWRVRSPWPVTDGSLDLPGLHGPVTVWRDARGVPSIHATDDHDLWFAQGFVHAQDRLWQMQLGRMFARGELAAAFGEAALDADRMVWTMGLPDAAAASEAQLDPDTRAALEAYADGVNALLDRGGPLPIEFAILGVTPDRWRVTDSLLVGEAIGLALGQNASTEVLRLRLAAKVDPTIVASLLPDAPDRYPVVVPAAPAGDAPPDAASDGTEAPPPLPGMVPRLGHPGAGSNAFVVAGSRTATGRPILANDTHLALSSPSVWYENGLYGGRYAVTGFSLPGAPFVAIGHTVSAAGEAGVAWGMTSLVSDAQDLYLERLDDPAAPTTYELDGQWLPLERTTHLLAVAGGEPVPFEVRSTRHGPLANQALYGAAGLPPVSLRSHVREGSTLFGSMAAMNRATDADAFVAALRGWDRPGVNFVYADTAGAIGYHAAGRIPVRPDGDTGQWPVEGWTTAHDWVGEIPFDALPQVRDPASGFVVTANNRVVGDDYPYTITHDWGDPFRAARLTDRLAAAGPLTIDDAAALQRDTFSVQADELVPFLQAAKPTDPVAIAALGRLDGWDRRFETDSVAATVYFVWAWKLVPAVFGDELGDPLMTDADPILRIQTDLPALLARADDPVFDDRRTADVVETRDVIVDRALAEAVAWLSDTLGDDPDAWTWGAVHHVGFQHQPLGQTGIAAVDRLVNPPELPVPGEGFAPDATGWDGLRPFAVTFGPAMRFVADLGDLRRSRGSTPLGASGLLFHPHSGDQLGAWIEAASYPMPSGPDEAAAAAVETLTLNPGGA